MNPRDDVRAFLMARRAALTPERAGINAADGDRRVPGLRREEVATLAGVSTDYYTRLERGQIRGASDSVLHAVARALQLSDVEQAHLFDLARRDLTDPIRRPATKPTALTVRPSLQRVLDNMLVPAVVYNARQDLVGSNIMGRAMFEPIFEMDRPNMARFIFLNSRARQFYDDWSTACSLTAAMLRLEAGRDPLNSELTALIGELSTRSPQFRADWADQTVHEHRSGSKTYNHPEVGLLRVSYDLLETPGENGVSICVYTADDSATNDKFTVLASWTATQGSNTRTTEAPRQPPPYP